MANKRNKKKLNSKQANKISLLISAIFFICTIVNQIISKPSGEYAENYWIMCISISFFIYYVFYFCIFKGIDKKTEARKKEIENVTEQYLSHTDFKQVYFLAKGMGNDIDMMRQILQKEECKFYAKLTQSNNIHLIVKDKHNEEVYSAEIVDNIYFDSNFTFKK